MINEASGELLTDSKWDKSLTISKQIRYTILSNIVEKNASIVALVYKLGSTLNTSEIQQAEKWNVIDSLATSVNPELTPITEFKLYQNFPNPFNPNTKISYQSPLDGFHSLKVFNIIGK